MPPWLKEAGLCEALTERHRIQVQMKSATYAAVRSGQGVLLRITADTASSAVCGAPHTAEFERDIIRERTNAGLEAARVRGKKGGRPRALTPEKITFARTLYADKKTSVAEICKMLGISRHTLQRYVKEEAKTV